MSNLEGKVFTVPNGVFFVALANQSFVIVDAKPKCRTWYYASGSAQPLWAVFRAAEKEKKGVSYKTLKEVLLNSFKYDDPAKVPEHLEQFVIKLLEWGLIEETKELKPSSPPKPPEKKKKYIKLEIMDILPLNFRRDIPVSAGGKK